MRRPSIRVSAVAAVACGLLAGPGVQGAAAQECAHANEEPGQVSVKALSHSTVCLLNQERARRGLHKLQMNRRLSTAARGHTVDMVRRHYFAHVSKSGRDVVDRLRHTGYLHNVRSWMVGENLAWGSGTRSTPAEIMDAWMHSPGHRANILTARFREIGIGVELQAPSPTTSAAATYTTTFGARN